MAEGFVKEMNGKTLEEIGWEYMIELIDQNLVQVSEACKDGKAARKCQLHDILHEIILQKMENYVFVMFYQKKSQVWKDKLDKCQWTKFHIN